MGHWEGTIVNIVTGVLYSVIRVLYIMPWWFFALIAALLVFKLTYGSFNHFLKIRLAERALKTLRKIESPAQQFGYLRSVDPFVFEEMILTALSKLGARITRNKRYTGDGGIDGRFKYQGKRYLVQAKRYKNHISAQQVEEFSDICRRKNKYGLFVHTGRTGKQSWRNKDSNIVMLSGQKMLDLLNGRALRLD